MNIMNSLRGDIYDTEFKMTMALGKLNIVNYETILNFDTKEIKIKHKDGILIIIGKSLAITKLMSEELLINGEIEKIELR